MFKTILVPIDFSVECLNTLKLALQKEEGNRVNVILIYSETLNSSISDLLFYKPLKQIKQLTNKEFDEAITIIKNRYESLIHIIRFELFHGKTTQAFKLFAEANKVDMIYVPKHYELTPLKNGFNPISLIRKSKMPFQEIEWNVDNYTFDPSQMSALFS
jgi:hypothetical protein